MTGPSPTEKTRRPIIEFAFRAVSMPIASELFFSLAESFDNFDDENMFEIPITIKKTSANGMMKGNQSIQKPPDAFGL